MESIYTELALYGNKNECARTGKVVFFIPEFCDGTVSLIKRTTFGRRRTWINCSPRSPDSQITNQDSKTTLSIVYWSQC